jgi:Iap family predicted aminopeptidase
VAPAQSTAPAGAPHDPAARLAEMMLAATPVEEDLRHLCDRIGGRPTGSRACDRSVDWFLEKFRQAGADLAWTEPFPVPHRWEGDRTAARVVTPEDAPLDAVAMPYSATTPKGGLERDVVFIGAGSAEEFERAGARLRGALLLLDSKVLVTFEDLFGDYLRMPAIMQRAEAAGAAGILVVGARDRHLLYRHIATFGWPAPLPMAILAREDGLRLARMAPEGRVRLRLEVAARTGPAYRSRNLLAEIRGRDRPEEIVLAGAHLDSWDLGTGALDNGANCAMLLDIARQMAALGTRPRRTVRFALFTGEEQGMFGSLGYVRAHRPELDRHAAVAIFDIGTGRFTGFSLGGREDLRPQVAGALRGVEGYGAGRHTADAFVGTDNYDFLLEGVPNLVASQAQANYMENYHASSDTFDKADLSELKINGAIAATLLWGLAESPERPARQGRAEIAEVMRRTGLADQMKTFGLWAEWERKERGRPD